MPRKYNILGVGIDNFTLEQLAGTIEEFIENKGFHFIVTANPLMLNLTDKNEKFKHILGEADLVVADGWGLVWAGRVLGYPKIFRQPGIDLVQFICRLSAEKGYRLYLFGGKPSVVEKAKKNLLKQYPGINIIGQRHGYFGVEEGNEILKEIGERRPDILLVGMGSPRQEEWIAEHKQRLEVPVCMGVGGSFDVLAGNLWRSPVWMRRLGLEWAGRFVQQPWRLRQIPGLASFVWKVIKQRFSPGEHGSHGEKRLFGVKKL